MAQRDPRKSPIDRDPVGHVGAAVFYHSPATRPRAATIGNVDERGGPVDLVVLCQGRALEGARERWGCGMGVVGFRGLIPHVTQALAAKSSVWWSRHAEDCEDGIEAAPSGT